MSTLTNTTFFDPPIVLDTSVTPIPDITSPPLQVIADSGVYITVAINFSDSTNQFIAVYEGEVGKEVLRAVIGNGVIGQSWCRILPHTRISLGSLTSASITSGRITANLSGEL